MTLKERIDRIIHTGEIELAGEAYKGKYELNNGKSINTNLGTGDKLCKILIIKKAARDLPWS